MRGRSRLHDGDGRREKEREDMSFEDSRKVERAPKPADADYGLEDQEYQLSDDDLDQIAAGAMMPLKGGYKETENQWDW